MTDEECETQGQGKCLCQGDGRGKEAPSCNLKCLPYVHALKALSPIVAMFLGAIFVCDQLVDVLILSGQCSTGGVLK